MKYYNLFKPIHGTVLLMVVLFMVACGPGSNQVEHDSNTPPLLTGQAPFMWENATVYFMLTDRFNNGNPENDLALGRKKDGSVLRSFMGGDLKGITQKIEEGYFNQLGVNALWFTPPIEQVKGYTDEGTGKTYAYHGYWARDWTAIDPNYGTMEDMAELVKKAHEHGIRILMDVVINHTGPVTAADAVWPSSWVRTEPTCAHNTFDSTVTCTLVKNLPDIRTESDAEVELPEFLKEKWEKEGRLEQELKELDEFFARTGHPRAPRFYIMKWLIDYVRELGIDGFRVDTVKHTEASVWKELFEEALKALEAWRAEHPAEKPGDEPFFMVGEVYGYAIGNGKEFSMEDTTLYYFDQGFKSLINFSFKSDADKNLDSVFTGYSKMSLGFHPLISSMKNALSLLLAY